MKTFFKSEKKLKRNKNWSKYPNNDFKKRFIMSVIDLELENIQNTLD